MPSRATTGSVSTLVSGSSAAARSRAPSARRGRSRRRRSRSARDRARRRPSAPTRARSRARSSGRPRARRRGRVRSRSRRGGRSTKRPTKSVTSAFGLACVPPTGSWESTMPSSVGSSCPRARRAYGSPAASSVVWAMATSCVVTSGTADVVGPFETVTRDRRALRALRAAARRLARDDARGLVGVLVDARHAEARALELRRRLVVRQPDDVRDGHRLRALRDVDPHLRSLDDDGAGARRLRGDRAVVPVRVDLDDLRVRARRA